jgi:hypothetical protein
MVASASRLESSWKEQSDERFLELRTKLTMSPLLSNDFRPNKPVTLKCDASIAAVACVLEKKDSSNKSHVIAYLRRQLTPKERLYGITEIECLAVFYGLTAL